MKKLSLAVLSIVVLYFGFIVFLAFSKGYDIEHMDWNNDGTTTFLKCLILKVLDLEILMKSVENTIPLKMV